MGRVGLALYAILVINVMGGVLDVAKNALMSFCRSQSVPSPASTPTPPSKDITDKKKD